MIFLSEVPPIKREDNWTAILVVCGVKEAKLFQIVIFSSFSLPNFEVPIVDAFQEEKLHEHIESYER